MSIRYTSLASKTGSELGTAQPQLVQLIFNIGLWEMKIDKSFNCTLGKQDLLVKLVLSLAQLNPRLFFYFFKCVTFRMPYRQILRTFPPQTARTR